MRDLYDAEHAEPPAAFTMLAGVLNDTRSSIGQLREELDQGELMNIGDTPEPFACCRCG